MRDNEKKPDPKPLPAALPNPPYHYQRQEGGSESVKFDAAGVQAPRQPAPTALRNLCLAR